MQQLTSGFFRGDNYGQSATASYRDGIFYSYNTKIACINHGNRTLSLRTDYFSRTTSSQQNALRNAARYYGYKVIDL